MRQATLIFAAAITLAACGTRDESNTSNMKTDIADVTCLTNPEFSGDPHSIIRGSKLVIKGDFKSATLSDYRARELNLTSPAELFDAKFLESNETFAVHVKDLAHTGTLYREGLSSGTFSQKGHHALEFSVDYKRLIMTCDNK